MNGVILTDRQIEFLKGLINDEIYSIEKNGGEDMPVLKMYKFELKQIMETLEDYQEYGE